MTTLVLVFKKIEIDDERKYNTFYSHSKAETIVIENDIYNVFESIYTKVISNIEKSLGKGSGWIINSGWIISSYKRCQRFWEET